VGVRTVGGVNGQDAYREWAPGADLAPRVACLWSRRSGRAGSVRIVPDGCIDVIWGPDGPFVAGPDTVAHLSVLRPGDEFFGIRFRPGALGGVLGVPAHALRDLRVPLDELPVPRGVTRERLIDAVAARLRETARPDPARAAIVRGLCRGGSVAGVARDLGISERQLHRRCVTAFGYGAKTLQRVMRFRRALRLSRSGVRLADVAVAAGYADQAHLANDVRRLAGVPLTELIDSSLPR
jgi:AraC-like DNA-binding protein